MDRVLARFAPPVRFRRYMGCQISIVVPVYRSADIVPDLVARIDAALRPTYIDSAARG